VALFELSWVQEVNLSEGLIYLGTASTKKEALLPKSLLAF